MDQYLEGYGEDYGALSTQSDILLSPDDEEEVDMVDVRKLRFGKQGRKVSREEEPIKSRSASGLEQEEKQNSETGRQESASKLHKLQRSKRATEADAATDSQRGMHQESHLENARSEEMQLTDVDQVKDGTRSLSQHREETMPVELKPSRSEDSMDAHMSYESSSSKSDHSERKGGVNLPLAEQHYTEGIRRLQLSREAYDEEHFGKVICNLGV